MQKKRIHLANDKSSTSNCFTGPHKETLLCYWLWTETIGSPYQVLLYDFSTLLIFKKEVQILYNIQSYS